MARRRRNTTAGGAPAVLPVVEATVRLQVQLKTDPTEVHRETVQVRQLETG